MPGHRALLPTALAGAVATGSGIGLARFAYVPLFPAMVAAGWVDGAGAGLLGAVNLAGYLLGVLGARALAARVGTPRALDLGMAVAALSCAACAWPGGLAWLAAWRGLAGAAGGVLMALAGPAVQAALPAAHRGAAAGIVVSGVGAGLVVAALLLPLLLPFGPAVAWAGLAVLIAALGAWAHPRWPVPAAVEATSRPPPAAALLLAYGLSGAGMVAPMVYLADRFARGLGAGVGAASLAWALFGVGAIAGTLLSGRAADRIGPRRALRLWLGLQVAALALMLVPATAALAVATLLGGFAGVGLTAVVLAEVRRRAGSATPALWARCTASYALAQAVVGFALAVVFAASGESHALVFGAGLALSIAAWGVGLATPR